MNTFKGAAVLALLCTSLYSNGQIPYGMVQLKDSVYLQEHEVTNAEWIEYIFYFNRPLASQLNIDHLSQAQVTADRLPDANMNGSSSVKKLFNFDSGFAIIDNADIFITRQAIAVPKGVLQTMVRDTLIYLLNQPVTGISRDQALAYCHWVGQLINHDFKTHYESTLPSSAMYQYVLSNRNRKDTPWLNGRKPIKKDKAPAIKSRINQVNFDHPDNFGVHALWDNAQEILRDGKVITGYKEDKIIAQDIPVPNSTTGFRCACEVKQMLVER